MTNRETPKTAKHELFHYLQTTLLKLGCLRFQTDSAPTPEPHDIIAWSIVLYEQSADLHRETFDDPASTANELRISRQCLNAQLASLMVLAATLPRSDE